MAKAHEIFGRQSCSRDVVDPDGTNELARVVAVDQNVFKAYYERRGCRRLPNT
jgi:hypothetical protein